MQGKPYAGNPHVRFDEGAGAPRHSGRSALLYRPLAAALALCAGVWAADTGACADSARTLSLDDYRDKMKAAWVEQMVGVSWGQPMEFKWNDVIIPADKVPEWASDFRSAWRTATTTSTWR